MDKLTDEELIARIEGAFSPHTAKARIHDYGAKLSFKVWSSKDGSHVYTVPDLPLDNLKTEHYLKDVLDGVRREVEAKLAAGA